MTLRTLVACASPLSGSHTVREHLAAINCSELGTGGDISFSARGSFAVSLKTMNFSMSGSTIGFKPLYRILGFNGGPQEVGFKSTKRIYKFSIGECDG